MDASDFRKFVLEHGFLDSVKPREMLFDLYLDPVERVNLAEDDRFIHIKQSMASLLDEWMEGTRDPILLRSGR
ncbi:hypothetical protein SAMN05421868_1931 [Paenibacillus naphthalenovorans]|nr:hypothetical protein SAMN05421868_1931 [Paenibacillus naphthalenovorans]